jgi:hypothetical protein
MPTELNVVIKEPFVYNEDVLYPELTDLRHSEIPNKSVYDALIDIKHVMPFGYPTEQFMQWIKQDIHNRLEEQRLKNRHNPDPNADITTEKDPGLLANETGSFKEIAVTAYGYNQSPVVIIAKVTDTLFNTYRRQLREGLQMVLRLYSAFPKSGGRSRSRSTTTKDDPILELNKFGFNPALERRVLYKYLTIASKRENQYVNIHYIVDHPDFETAYRADV